MRRGDERVGGRSKKRNGTDLKAEIDRQRSAGAANPTGIQSNPNRTNLPLVPVPDQFGSVLCNSSQVKQSIPIQLINSRHRALDPIKQRKQKKRNRRLSGGRAVSEADDSPFMVMS